MKILITGNLGYVGPGLIKEFRSHYPNATIIGYDLGFFARNYTHTSIAPETFLDAQYYGDMRDFPAELLKEVDTVVDLAAISNDPIGNKFEEVTLDINYRANIRLAEMAKEAGVTSYIFASSCSVYGAAGDGPRTEEDQTNPLTAYAKSKIFSERDLAPLADDNFKITCLRFATACGMSDRLRLDLVLNDFVANAIATGEILILSDGSPWRPLIHVLDMARAIRWAHERDAAIGGNNLVINVGSNVWNYQIKDLALAVKEILPEISVSINKDAEPDKRSYQVNFDLFEKLAPNHQPQFDLAASIDGLVKGLKAIEFSDANFRTSDFIRLQVVNRLLESGAIDQELRVVAPQLTTPVA